MSDTNLEMNIGNQRASFSGADFVVIGYAESVETDPGSDDISDNFIEFANIQTLSISTTRDIEAKRPLGTSWPTEYSRGSRTVAGSLVFTLFDSDSLSRLKGVRKSTTVEDRQWYSIDDIPPFNIIVTATNEYGSSISGVLLGVVIPNSGITVGVQDAYTEQVCSYVARRWVPFRNTIDLSKGLNEAVLSHQEIRRVLSAPSDRLPTFFRKPNLKPIDRDSIDRE